MISRAFGRSMKTRNVSRFPIRLCCLSFTRSTNRGSPTTSAAYDRSYASERRQNVAPHRLSGRLGYSLRRFNGSIGVIWADDKPESGTYGRYFSQITKVDLSLNFRLTRYATLFVQGRNITNMHDRWYQSPPGTLEGENGYLRQIEEYGSNWVFGVKGQF